MIHIITTGGTIEGLDSDLPDQNSSNSKVSLKYILETAGVSFPFKIEEAFKKDSREITPEDRSLLIERIKASSEDKILITHGTYTMEDTARYIASFKLKKTIVLVGSFILGSLKHTDAPFNLGFAICSIQFLNPDVYIAMNGQIFHWSNVKKNLETNKFESYEK